MTLASLVKKCANLEDEEKNLSFKNITVCPMGFIASGDWFNKVTGLSVIEICFNSAPVLKKKKQISTSVYVSNEP